MDIEKVKEITIKAYEWGQKSVTINSNVSGYAQIGLYNSQNHLSYNNSLYERYIQDVYFTNKTKQVVISKDGYFKLSLTMWLDLIKDSGFNIDKLFIYSKEEKSYSENYNCSHFSLINNKELINHLSLYAYNYAIFSKPIEDIDNIDNNINTEPYLDILVKYEHNIPRDNELLVKTVSKYVNSDGIAFVYDKNWGEDHMWITKLKLVDIPIDMEFSVMELDSSNDEYISEKSRIYF